MADTTLRPLTADERRQLDPRTDDEVLAQALARFQQASDAESDQRLDQHAALRFRAGEHWPPHLLASRSQPGRERPCLVINRQETYIDQVVNGYRRSPLGLRVRPKAGGATKAVADILEGKCRDIEQDSEADIAFTAALDQATGQGLGYFRLTLDYEDDYSFQQCPRITAIHNRFSVYADPAAVHPAGLDFEWFFVIEEWDKGRFLATYDVRPEDLLAWCGPEDQIWHKRDTVQVGEYYYRVWTPETLVQCPDGTVLLAKDLDAVDPAWPTRETRLPTVYGVTLCGHAILSKTRWPGRYVPLIRVEGKRLDLDGTTQRRGMTQMSMDAQMAYDFGRSAMVEAINLAPKAPYLAYAEQLAGYEYLWEQANDAQLPYLLMKTATDRHGNLLPPPRREVAEPAIQAITQAVMLAADDMKATLGMYDAAVGAAGNEVSGAAINARKIEGDQTNFTYPANLAWSIRALGVQLLDLLPKLYRGPTSLRQVSPDGTVKTTPVNQPYRDAQGQMQQHVLAQGSYEVVIDSGPAYATQREMAAEKLGQLGAAAPDLVPYFADLWTGSLDIPHAEDIAARLKTAVPPQALEATKDLDPENRVAALQNQLAQTAQQLQQMAQQLQQSKTTEETAVQQVKLLEQSVAAMQARLQDKTTENQLTAQKQQMDYDIDRGKLQLEAQKLGMAAQQYVNGATHPPQE